MELTQYIRLFRKWLWLIFLAAFVAGGVSFIFRSQRADEYQAEATVLIGSFLQQTNPNASDIQAPVELAQTYAVITETENVLQSTIDSLNLTLSVGQLRNIIDTRIVPETSLLVIQSTYTDPVLAADIANEVTRQLVLNSPTNLTPAQQSQLEFNDAQILRLSNQLEDANLQLDAIEEQLENATDPEQERTLNAQRDTLVNQINQITANLAQFSSTNATLQQRTNYVDIVEEANIPTNPVGTSVLQTTLLAALVGAALGFGVALLVEYLNDKISTSTEVAQLLNMNVLGVIPRFGKKNDSYQERLLTNQEFSSSISEAYNTLQSNLVFSSANGHGGTYLITSPGPRDGKSVTAANLAISMALAGYGVLLVDADLRRPKVHQVFELPNEMGLTNMLFMEALHGPIDGSGNSDNENQAMNLMLRDCLQNTTVPRLKVITSGPLPQNPTKILGTDLFDKWIRFLRHDKSLHYIVVDSPPSLVVSDSIMIAGSIKDVEALMVLRAGQSRSNDALKVKERFENLNMQLKGVILNGINPREEDYYGYSYSYYYTDAKQ